MRASRGMGKIKGTKVPKHKRPPRKVKITDPLLGPPMKDRKPRVPSKELT